MSSPFNRTLSGLDTLVTNAIEMPGTNSKLASPYDYSKGGGDRGTQDLTQPNSLTRSTFTILVTLTVYSVINGNSSYVTF